MREVDLFKVAESYERLDSRYEAGRKNRIGWAGRLFRRHGRDFAAAPRRNDLSTIEPVSHVDLRQRRLWTARQWPDEKAHCARRNRGEDLASCGIVGRSDRP